MRENLVPCPSKQLVIISTLEYKPGEDVKTCNERVSELILRKHMAVSFQVPTDINSWAIKITFILNPGSPIDFQLDFCMNALSFSYQLHAALVGLALCDVLDIVQRDVKLKLNSFLDLKFKQEFDSPGILFKTQKYVFKSTWNCLFYRTVSFLRTEC